MALVRFVQAQSAGVYESALAELQAGRKDGHWMWFVFPQIKGLGRSSISRFYAIDGRTEAASYLAHPLLGPRLAACTEAMLTWAGIKTPRAILGDVDAQKFASAMTLFEVVAPTTAPFAHALDALCGGVRDPATLARI